ncbi:ankyrin repeat-containing domain protein [Lactarius hatsudake]|nr:ankyrin repeat-containing domain protein [Lactarius hatsudake]
MVLVHDNDLAAALHGIYDGTPIESLQPDAMLSHLRSAELKIHEIPLGQDAKTARVATLSNIFEESSPSSSTPPSSRSRYHVNSPSPVVMRHLQDVNARGGDYVTPLHATSALGYLKVALLFLEQGADVNLADNFGRTPLHLAAQKGHSELAALLLEHGGNVNAQDVQQQTPLFYAVQEGQLEAARVLISCGADVRAQDKNGVTTLHLAAWKNHSEIATLLLEYGADANANNLQQQSALFYAAQEGKLEVTRILLQYGADVGAWDKNGETLLHLAAGKIIRRLPRCFSNMTPMRTPKIPKS